ncbi:MAG: FAD-dependent monooxygenase, partial [Planctomycetota bacterium]
MPTQSIIVIGGGPGGCVAACRLREHGFEVTLVEAARFPRDKVCGECVSTLGLAALASAGLGETFNALTPNLLRRVSVVSRGGRSFDANLPQPMAGVTRRVMDVALLDAARQRGVNVLQPAKARLVDGGVEVRRLDTGQTRTLAADLVVLADGKSNFDHRPTPTGDFGLKVH